MSERMRFRNLLVVLLLCGACDRVEVGPRGNALSLTTTSQAAIEALASQKPFPGYPARSLENGVAGVAVASILIGPDGRMERVEVLDAPDADIGKAMLDALGRWVLPPGLFEDDRRGRFKVSATMVFYFLIEAGEARVVSGPALAAARVSDHAVAGELRRIDEAEFEALLETDDAVVIDPRERELYARGHREGAINIPVAELESRAALELSAARVIIVDCYRSSGSMCDVAARILRLVGSDVAVFVHD